MKVSVIIERTLTERATVEWDIDEEDYAEWLGGDAESVNSRLDFIRGERYVDEGLAEVASRPSVHWDEEDLELEVVEVVP